MIRARIAREWLRATSMYPCMLAPRCSLATGKFVHRGDQVFELERLVERFRRADLARDREHVEIHHRVVAAHGDDLCFGKLAAQLDDHLDAFHFRHEDVGDDHVGRPGALQRQPLGAVGSAFAFDAVLPEPGQRELPEVFVILDDESAHLASSSVCPAQSSVKLSHATASHATASHATASHATASHATASHATASHATASQLKLSQATASHATLFHVSASQSMPPSVGSFQ